MGNGDGQITAVVLRRARAYHQKKVRDGTVRNPCYFAFDATRPAGKGRRFYVICEGNKTFRAVPSSHGAGRNFSGVVDPHQACRMRFLGSRQGLVLHVLGGALAGRVGGG